MFFAYPFPLVQPMTVKACIIYAMIFFRFTSIQAIPNKHVHASASAFYRPDSDPLDIMFLDERVKQNDRPGHDHCRGHF